MSAKIPGMVQGYHILAYNLSFVIHTKETKYFAGDFMDNQWSFRICVQTQAPLKNFGETAKLVF